MRIRGTVVALLALAGLTMSTAACGSSAGTTDAGSAATGHVTPPGASDSAAGTPTTTRYAADIAPDTGSGTGPTRSAATLPNQPATHTGTLIPPPPTPPVPSGWPAACHPATPPKPVPGHEFYRVPMGPQFSTPGAMNLPQQCFALSNGTPDLKNWVVQLIVVDTKDNVRKPLTLHRTDAPVTIGRFTVHLGPTTRAGQTFDVIVDWA